MLLFIIFVFTGVQCANVDYYHLGDEKIVGGFQANMKDFYYQVSLRIMDYHFCGGAVITDRFVLTAGHCIYPHLSHPTMLSIQVGTTNVGSLEGQVINVSRVFMHKDFNATSLDYDIALVELNEELDFTATARPIRVTRKKRLPWNELAVVSGWGYTSEDGVVSKTLQAVQVPLISREACKLYYKNNLTKNMICAGYIEGLKDACQGDSGGPLVYERELIGIVSWGRGCARPKRPGVYTNIAEMREFIAMISGIV